MTLSTSQATSQLTQDQNANWTYAGATALVEYLEGLEEDTGEEIEFDLVAIRCDYSQFGSLAEWAEDYFADGLKDSAFGLDEDAEDDDKEEAIREYIQDNGQLIEFGGGIIVSSF